VENPPDSVHVLIIDDELSIREGSQRILSRIGFRVSTAENGTDALELLDKDRATLVLLDMKMPGMDGMEVLQRIRELDESILIIVITGFATLETAVEAMKLGAYDFIPKPFETAQLRIVANRARDRITLMQDAQTLAQEKKRTLLDLDTEKSRVRTILESLPTGTLVTNNLGQVVLMNPALRRLLSVDPDVDVGSSIATYLSDEGLRELILAISRGQYIDFEDIPSVELSVGEQYFQVRGRPVLGERNECLGAVVTVDDITAMKTLDRLKSEFVAKVSHELRSPLATIHEQLAIVLSAISEMAPSGDRQMLARAKEKTHGLISLIGDLLDLSRIEEGTLCATPEPVQPGELLGSIVSFLRTRAEARRQTLTLTLPDATLPTLKADPLALESIFGNLIANAINYTPDGGDIRVEVDAAGSHLRVRVIDNGYGIEARHHEKIFERFYRVKNEQTRFITGTGLGLPIVRQLVETLGGLVELESEPGRGTAFTVLLPWADPGS
jgi:signal transduction histidine kinase/FixJ family two-component response regulator